MRNYDFLFVIAFCLTVSTCARIKAPFIEPNSLHPTASQFEFNLILNENRNIPIILVQYSRNRTQEITRSIISDAFHQEPDISFALFIDCRQFSYDLNNSLGICRGFSDYVEKQYDEDVPEDEKVDPFFRFQFFSPNPTRIKEKGHLLLKNHDHQNLRQLNPSFNANFLVKVIRNQIPDLVTYIEDQNDLEDFLRVNSNFRTSKKSKLLYFDANQQAPLFLKKLAANLDGRISIGVTDNTKIAKKYQTNFDSIVLLEFNFQTNTYQAILLHFDSENPLRSILDSGRIQMYTDIRKPRNILLDFEHKSAKIENLKTVKQINQLISHGRIILLQISENQQKFNCTSLKASLQRYDQLFNYVCLKKEKEKDLMHALQDNKVASIGNKVLFIDQSIKQAKIIESNEDNLYKYLPKIAPRQQITSPGEADLCIKAAVTSERDPIFFYFNEKTHEKSLSLVKYFNSLPEVNSILYFCQFYLPDEDVKNSFQLKQNTLFTLSNLNKKGQMNKIQHSHLENFISIKMFLREIAISKMLKIYDQKLISNQLQSIKSAQELTQKCFNEKCVIGLLETNKFHEKTELEILKELKIIFSEENYKFYWIDGVCHYEIAKQLKLVGKKQKLMTKSYLLYYQQKQNSYALWKGNPTNKYWIKQDIIRWVKSLRDQINISRLKFGIDIEDKQCFHPATQKLKEKVSSSNIENKNKSKEIKQGEL